MKQTFNSTAQQVHVISTVSNMTTGNTIFIDANESLGLVVMIVLMVLVIVVGSTENDNNKDERSSYSLWVAENSSCKDNVFMIFFSTEVSQYYSILHTHT